MVLDLTSTGRDWLATEGYDPVYGARPLKRVIQRELQNPLAQMILDGTLGEGDTIRVTGGRLGLKLA
jgi:ATP-dependent Clp protease ATP-binding subunit ClpB